MTSLETMLRVKINKLMNAIFFLVFGKMQAETMFTCATVKPIDSEDLQAFVVSSHSRLVINELDAVVWLLFAIISSQINVQFVPLLFAAAALNAAFISRVCHRFQSQQSSLI